MGHGLLLALLASRALAVSDVPCPELDFQIRIDVAAALKDVGAEVFMDKVFPDRVVAVGFYKGTPPSAFWALLESCPDLQKLYLIRSGVQDDDLAHLKHLKNLREICLAKTAISDKGLARLADVPQLAQVSCEGTRVTRDGARKLMQARPGIQVDW